MAGFGYIAKSAARLLTQRGLCCDMEWGGVTYQGTRTTLKRESVNTDAGLAGEYAFSVLCPCAQFNGTFPESRISTVTIGDKSYRVLSLDFDALMATVRINLGDLLA